MELLSKLFGPKLSSYDKFAKSLFELCNNANSKDILNWFNSNSFDEATYLRLLTLLAELSDNNYDSARLAYYDMYYNSNIIKQYLESAPPNMHIKYIKEFEDQIPFLLKTIKDNSSDLIIITGSLFFNEIKDKDSEQYQLLISELKKDHMTFFSSRELYDTSSLIENIIAKKSIELSEGKKWILFLPYFGRSNPWYPLSSKVSLTDLVEKFKDNLNVSVYYFGLPYYEIYFQIYYLSHAWESSKCNFFNFIYHGHGMLWDKHRDTLSNLTTESQLVDQVLKINQEHNESVANNGSGTKYVGNPFYLIYKSAAITDIASGNFNNAIDSLRKYNTFGLKDSELLAYEAFCYDQVGEAAESNYSLTKLKSIDSSLFNIIYDSKIIKSQQEKNSIKHFNYKNVLLSSTNEIEKYRELLKLHIKVQIEKYSQIQTVPEEFIYNCLTIFIRNMDGISLDAALFKQRVCGRTESFYKNVSYRDYETGIYMLITYLPWSTKETRNKLLEFSTEKGFGYFNMFINLFLNNWPSDKLKYLFHVLLCYDKNSIIMQNAVSDYGGAPNAPRTFTVYPHDLLSDKELEILGK